MKCISMWCWLGSWVFLGGCDAGGVGGGDIWGSKGKDWAV